MTFADMCHILSQRQLSCLFAHHFVLVLALFALVGLLSLHRPSYQKLPVTEVSTEDALSLAPTRSSSVKRTAFKRKSFVFRAALFTKTKLKKQSARATAVRFLKPALLRAARNLIFVPQKFVCRPRIFAMKSLVQRLHRISFAFIVLVASIVSMPSEGHAFFSFYSRHRLKIARMLRSEPTPMPQRFTDSHHVISCSSKYWARGFHILSGQWLYLYLWQREPDGLMPWLSMWMEISVSRTTQASPIGTLQCLHYWWWIRQPAILIYSRPVSIALPRLAI